MNRNAQREVYTDALEVQQDLYAPELFATGTEGALALRQIAAERLAAHRKRRAAVESRQSQEHDTAATGARSVATTPAAQKVRDAVAARYQQTPSFREYMAAEAEGAVQKTQADAESAVRAAKAVADVQLQLMTELQQWPSEAVTDTNDDPDFAWVSGTAKVASPRAVAGRAFEVENSELRVRHFEALPQKTLAPPPGTATNEIPDWVAQAAQAYHAEELRDLNEEIEFRLSPEFHEHLLEPLPIQANIIEFPRQLVAARKARPRLAEGPLRADVEGADAARPAEFQMRIFEVEAEQISVTPAVAEETTLPHAPEWQSLTLDASQNSRYEPLLHTADANEVVCRPAPLTETRLKEQLRSAPMELRVMAFAVDAICLGASCMIFLATAAVIPGTSAQQMSLPLLIATAGVLLLMLFVMYQGLFFSLGRSTPGMYYANLVFRAMDGSEPSRSAMRKRIGANLLAAAPLGLGLLWAVVDGDGLGWNDRMSGVYLKEF